MSNTLTYVAPVLLAQGLMALRQNTIMPWLVNRDYESAAAEKNTSITIPIPSAVAVQDVIPGAYSTNTPDLSPTGVSLTLDAWKEAPFYLSDKDMAEAMDGTIPMQASEAVKSLANTVDAAILGLYTGVYGYTGTAGTTPFASDTTDATGARKVLNNQLAALGDRRMVIDADAEANALNLRAFQDMSFSGDAKGIIEGQINRKLGFDWFMDQNVMTHTVGTHTALYQVDQTNVAVGDVSINVDTGTGTWLIGDIFTVAGDTQTYVVTANELTGGSDKTLAFLPAAKVAWADDALITWKSSHIVNLAFHRGAFVFASRPLVDNSDGLGNLIQSATDPVSGISLRLEISREHKRTRFSYDILYGVKLVRAELACRVAG